MPNHYACSRRSVIAGSIALGMMRGAPAFAASTPFDAFVLAQMRTASIPGLALGIARKGMLVLAKGYGLADIATHRQVTPKTMFHIASITKTVTASVVMQLVDQQRIALDDRVAPHLDFRIAGEGAEDITFRHLLEHTSGISDEVYYAVDFRARGSDATIGLGALVKDYFAPGGRYTGPTNVTSPPGSRWAYSNMGFALLGYLVNRIGGEDLKAYSARRLFAPLGLHHVSWTLAGTPQHLRATPYDPVEGKLNAIDPVGSPDYPGSMIRASIGDVTMLVAAAANQGVAKRIRLLSPQANARMLEMTRPEGLAEWLTGQGLGWQQSALGGIARANHWGGDPGVLTMAYLAPETATAVVVLSNLSATKESRDAMKAIVKRALAESPA